MNEPNWRNLMRMQLDLEEKLKLTPRLLKESAQAINEETAKEDQLLLMEQNMKEMLAMEEDIVNHVNLHQNASDEFNELRQEIQDKIAIIEKNVGPLQKQGEKIGDGESTELSTEMNLQTKLQQREKEKRQLKEQLDAVNKKIEEVNKFLEEHDDAETVLLKVREKEEIIAMLKENIQVADSQSEESTKRMVKPKPKPKRTKRRNSKEVLDALFGSSPQGSEVSSTKRDRLDSGHSIDDTGIGPLSDSSG